MIKWFAYIILLLIFAPCLSYAKIENHRFNIVFAKLTTNLHYKEISNDTVIVKNNKKQEQEEKNKIKEVAKAKKQPKPEKIESIDPATSKTKQRPKRQRRPEGLERPPEIPRRNGN
jgi:hypothetical protein